MSAVWWFTGTYYVYFIGKLKTVFNDVDLRIHKMKENSEFFIIGVGASAGGMEALQRLFNSISDDIPAAFIVIQHITQENKNLTRDLLAKHTTLQVADAEDGAEIKRGRVYFTPTYKTLKVTDGFVKLEDRPHEDTFYQPIDIMLTSLAKSEKSRAVAIILSGTGTDGSRGIRFIHENGGLVLVQQPVSAQFNGMPLMAISTGVADYII